MNTQKYLIALLMLLVTHASFSQTNPEIKKLAIDPETNCYLRYYYFPNLQAYFDLLNREYIFKHNGEWHYAAELPQNYGGYSLYKTTRTFITDYDGEEPFQFLDTHKKHILTAKTVSLKRTLKTNKSLIIK
jgi:hypothetical protein